MKHPRILASAVSAFALATAGVVLAPSALAQAGDALTVRAGDGETGYSVNLFLPSEITVATDTTVTFEVPWNEPHTVTFGTPTGDPTVPSVPLDVPYDFDGSSYFSSGLIGPGFSDYTSFSITFSTAGSYDIYCAIHPFMTGKVDVVASGDVDTQEELDANGAAQYEPALAALKSLATDLAGSVPESIENADGSTTHNAIVSGATMDGDVMQFFPPSQTIKVGDSVKWVNDTPVPHTVTFNMQDFPGGDPFEVPRTDSSEFDGTGFTNSGIIGVDFPDGTTYELVFTEPGTYQYVCILHASQGMVGTLTVEGTGTPEPTTPAPTATPTTAAPQPPSTGSGTAATPGGSPVPFAVALGVLLVVAGVGVIGLRRAHQ